MQWLEIILSTALRKKSSEDRQLSSKLCRPISQPLVCFALCTGAFSDPVVTSQFWHSFCMTMEFQYYFNERLSVSGGNIVVLPVLESSQAIECPLKFEQIIKSSLALNKCVHGIHPC